MSQNTKDFQSKPRSGGQKFGGKKGFGGKGGGRPFRERSEGDKGGFRKEKRDFSDRPARADRGDRPQRDGFKPKRREFGDRDSRPAFDRDRPKRDFGDRPPRREGAGDRPYHKPRFDRDGDKPKRSFGDRPKRDFGDKPKRSFDDRPKRDFGDRPKRDFGDRPKRSFDDRPKRDFGDRPKRSFDDRPKRDFGDRPKRDFGDRPKRSFDDRPKRDFSDRPMRDDAAPPQRRDASSETRQKLKSDRPNYGSPSSAFLYGVHAVTEALLNKDRLVQRLLVTQSGFAEIELAYAQALDNGLQHPQPIYVEKEDIDRLLPRDAVHQGILLDCQPLGEVFLADILIQAKEDSKILVLDQVTDPHNVGAILRSASAFGALAVVAQKIHAPDITGTLAKTASGAAEHIPFVREVNLSRTLEQLKEAGFFCIGLAEDGKRTLAEMKLEGKIALVLGAEGEGLRRLVAENCDELAKLPTQGRIGSLNVSNAAAVALYELIRK